MDESIQPVPLPNCELVGTPQPTEAAEPSPLLPPAPRAGPPWVFLDIFRLLLFVLCIWIVMLFLILICFVMIALRFGSVKEIVDPTNPALLLSITVLIELPFIFHIHRTATKRYKQSFWHAINWFRLRDREASFFIGGIGLCFLSLIFNYYFHSPEPPSLLRLMTNARSAYSVALFAIIVAPFVEEVVFRGFLYPIFRNLAGVPVAILLTALLFAGAHGPPGLPEWFYFSFIGAVLAYYRWKTDSLIPPYLLHTAHNFALFALVFIATDRFRAFGG